VALQLEIVRQAVGVAAVVFWSGWQTKQEMKSAPKPVEPIDIYNSLCSVGSLPWPQCA
jgi:hypothetical protein